MLFRSVTFDIDANGLVNVTAKDLGTGKQQNITITASSNMSKEDVEKAVREAEQFADEDRANKEAIDIKNQADQMVYQSEKTLTDLGDKIDEQEKSQLQAAIEALKEVQKSDDIELIKSKTEELTQLFYKMSEKLYSQTGAQGEDPGAASQGDPFSGGAASDDNVVDADFTPVDEDKKED